MSRSRFRSGISRPGIYRSSFGFRRGFRGTSGSVPLKGPVAIIFSIGMILLSFAFNFFYILTTDEFNPLIFFIPIGVMMVTVITTMIFSIIAAFKGQPLNGMNQNLPMGGLGPSMNILMMAQQAGFKITMLPNQDPSTAQGLIQSDKVTVLIKILPGFQPYQNGMVQDLSKGLATYQANEAWLLQNPATFVENDLNFARFYNVKLMTIEQAVAALQTLTAPKPDVGQ
jgi:hypothetical protein